MDGLSQTRWFIISVFIISSLGLAFLIANAVFMWRVRSAGGCGGVSLDQATAVFWIDIVLCVFFFILMLWSLWRIIFSARARKQIIDKISETIQKPQEGLIKEFKKPSFKQTSYPTYAQQYQTEIPVPRGALAPPRPTTPPPNVIPTINSSVLMY